MQLSSASVDFYLFYDWLVDMQKCGLWTRSQCRVSDTQVIVKALGPLIITVLCSFFMCENTYFCDKVIMST